MAKKKTSGGIVFSTDPDFKRDEEPEQPAVTLNPSAQKLRLRLDTKQRAGKAVTLVQGFVGTTNDLEALGKQLKAYCGTGGSVKEGEIIVQGDNRYKILTWLLQKGFTGTKKI